MKRLITQNLRDEDYDHHPAVLAVVALGESAKNNLPSIKLLLRSDEYSSDEKAAALYALVSMGTAETEISTILETLTDKDADVRLAAVRTLASSVSRSHTASVAKLLRDPDADVRAAAVRALTTLGETEHHVADILALWNNDKEATVVRVTAAQVLASLGVVQHDQIPALAKLFDEPELVVLGLEKSEGVLRAIDVMDEVEGSKITQLVGLLGDPDSAVRICALRALCSAEQLDAIQVRAIVSQLKGDDTVVTAALHTLASLGQLAAQEVASLLNDSDEDSRYLAALLLGTMGENARPYLKGIVQLLVPSSNEDSKWLNLAPLLSLAMLGDHAGDYLTRAKRELPPVLEYYFKIRKTPGEVSFALRHSSSDDLTELVAEQLRLRILRQRRDAEDFSEKEKETGMFSNSADRLDLYFYALEQVAPLRLRTILVLLAEIQATETRGDRVLRRLRNGQNAKLRFNAHYLGGGARDVEIALKWLHCSEPAPLEGLTRAKALETLTVFEECWEPSKRFPGLFEDLQRQIAKVAVKTRWKKEDIVPLRRLAEKLKSIGSKDAVTLQDIVSPLETSLERKLRVLRIGYTWAAHALLWILFILAYPKSPKLQAIIFWNPWARRIFGFGYVGFLLTWVPLLRRILIAPFRSQLLSDAALKEFDRQAYFENSEVEDKVMKRKKPIKEAIPEIRGRIVLEGESGLGKSMFLRYLAKQSKRIVVFLPAERCVNGVLEAIRARMAGPASDPSFLQSLIYIGAIDICIDGLNQVPTNTLLRITDFVQSHFRGNIIMSTQNIGWTPAEGTSVFTLQPLSKESIERFLAMQKESFADATHIKEYDKACKSYLKKYEESKETILSNPMDLTIVAQIIANGESPDLYHLQQQQYNLMAAEFKKKYLNDFPLSRFSKIVYDEVLNGRFSLPENGFSNELEVMARHKMVFTRRSEDAQGTPTILWIFRHGKIREFFLQAFLKGSEELLKAHVEDPRFKGVYVFLARSLSSDKAHKLKKTIEEYSRARNDYTLFHAYINALSLRKDS